LTVVLLCSLGRTAVVAITFALLLLPCYPLLVVCDVGPSSYGSNRQIPVELLDWIHKDCFGIAALDENFCGSFSVDSKPSRNSLAGDGGSLH